jgi:hypothetical protein
MRLAILFSGCLGFVTTSPSKGAPFAETRNLPPLRLAASDLDAILSRTHSFLNTVNGRTGEDSTRESVKLNVDGHEIDIPHFSLASSVAFPNKIFRFCYAYSRRDDKAVSSVTIDLSDSSRRVSVSGESADKVGALSNLLENEFRRYARKVGGMRFRRVAGVCLSMLFLTSLMVSSAYCWKTQSYSALGMPICSALGFLLVVLLPWNRLLPGFVLYQHYSPFFLIRHASQIYLLGLLAVLCGIPLSYFLSRSRRKV